MFEIIGRFLRALISSGQYARHLATLVSASHEERRVLSAMLTEVTVSSQQLTQVSAALRQVEAEAVRARQELDCVTSRLAELQQSQRTGADIDERIRQLNEGLAVTARRAAQGVARLDAQVQQQRDAMQRLSSGLEESMAAVDAMARRITALEHAPPSLPPVPRAQHIEVDRADTSARWLAVAGVAAVCLIVAYATFGERWSSSVAERTPPTIAAVDRSTETAATIVPAVLQTPAPVRSAPRLVERPRARRSSQVATEGALRVTSIPSGARVTVNGIGWGTTPLTIRHLSLGEKDIRLTRDGYLSQERTIRLTTTAPERSVEVSLRPDSQTAMQTVAPVDAREIWVAGRGLSEAQPVLPAPSAEVALRPRSTAPVVVRGARTLWRGVTKVFVGR